MSLYHGSDGPSDAGDPAGRARTGRRRALSGGVAALALTALVICLGTWPSARAATLPPGFAETTVASGLSNPTAMAFAPDGRLFVAEQAGRLRVIKNGQLLPTPFLTLTVNSSGERGLLGVAFDPSFAANRFVYVYYTATTPAVHNRLSRFTANGDVAVAGSEVVLLELDNLSGATNHNGGALHFGADGKLYVAVGENATPSNAQTLSNLLGKLLRLNADGTVPADNPFVGQATGKNGAIWALGLRNPYTFAVQPGTGRIFVNDVGSSGAGRREEIDEGAAGANYGWPGIEGYRTTQPLPGIGTYRDPVFAYDTAAEGGCAITGGAFYNPASARFPAAYVGKYFFADFCGGWIRTLDPATRAVAGFATGIANPVDLQVGADGALYYLARGNGTVVRVGYAASPTPTPTVTPTATPTPTPRPTATPTPTPAWCVWYPSLCGASMPTPTPVATPRPLWCDWYPQLCP